MKRTKNTHKTLPGSNKTQIIIGRINGTRSEKNEMNIHRKTFFICSGCIFKVINKKNFPFNCHSLLLCAMFSVNFSPRPLTIFHVGRLALPCGLVLLSHSSSLFKIQKNFHVRSNEQRRNPRAGSSGGRAQLCVVISHKKH